MNQWVCRVCRYSQVGEDAPAECPVCKARPESFEPIEDGATEPELCRPATMTVSLADSTWRCQVCSYEHRGAQPPDFCPICGVGPELFDRGDVGSRVDTDRVPTAGAIACTVCNAPASDPPAPACTSCGCRTAFVGPAAALPRVSAQLASRNAKRRYVIVGSGVAATRAAEEIRASDAGAWISILTREVCLPYQRVNLTRHLGGEVDAAGLMLHPPGWYVERGIEVRLETDVRDLDVREHLVRTRFGPVRYDRLVLATGARVAVPPIPNGQLDGVVAMRTFSDAARVLRAAGSRTRAVVVGGGLLGLETAYALFRRGCDVTVCEGSEWLMHKQLDAAAGRMLRQHLETKGIRFVFGDRPQGFAGEERVRAVALASGKRLPADLVLLATGIAPNVEVAVDAGLDVVRGIVVDDHLSTSDGDVLAAGDAAEHAGRTYGQWATALQMGAIAGRNAAGAGAAFVPPTLTATLKVVDIDVFSAGKIEAAGESSRELVHASESGPVYQKLVTEGGAVVGAILIGDTRGASQLMAAVRDRADVRELVQRAHSVGDILRALEV